MKNIIRSVISRGAYNLSAMLKKIDTLWVQGSISDEEREELMSLARGNADVQQSIDILAKVEEHEKRLAELEELVKNLTASKEDTEDGEEVTEESYDEYVVGKWYYNGDGVMFGGKAYECTAPVGTPCVWSPSDYPAYWSEK